MFAAVVEALSARDRVSAGRSTIFPAVAETVSVKPMVSEIKTTYAAVVETLSDRDRVDGGSKATFDPIR